MEEANLVRINSKSFFVSEPKCVELTREGFD